MDNEKVKVGIRIFGIVLAVLVVGGLVFSMVHPMGTKPMSLPSTPTTQAP